MSRYYSENLFRDIDNYLEDQDALLRKRPLCCWCDEHIQGMKLYNINGKIYCEDCIDKLFTWTDELDDPVCCECGKHVGNDGLSTVTKVDGNIYCDGCLNIHIQFTDDFID